VTADDVQAQVRAAIQQVRTSTPRECDEWCATIAEDGTDAATHSDACWLRWAERVDARLAVCVEAAMFAGATSAWNRALVTRGRQSTEVTNQGISDAGLAAFLAAAAQEEAR